MINSMHSKIQKIISCALAQIFIFTSLLSPQDSIYKTYKRNIDYRLRVPLGIDRQRAGSNSLASPVPEILYNCFTGKDTSLLKHSGKYGMRLAGKEIEKWRKSLIASQNIPEENTKDPVLFSRWMVEDMAKDLPIDRDSLYVSLMSYASFIRYNNSHKTGHQIALNAAGLKPGKEEHDQSVDKYLEIFINKLKGAKGSDIHRLKAATEALKQDKELKTELLKEFPLRYDLIRHFIAYVDQIPEDGSEIGGDVTMIGSPVKFIEYLESCKSVDENITALIDRVKKRVAGESKFLEEKNPPKKRPGIIKQLNLDAEAGSRTNKFKWLTDNIAKYKGYDAIVLVGSLQAMGSSLSPYEYAGLYFDPRYGSDKDFKLLVDIARKRGIEIAVDVVLEHTGVSDSAGRPFPDSCYSAELNMWTNKLDYSKDETVMLATWFLRRLGNLGVRWVRADQMGGLGGKGYKVWEEAHKFGIGIIGEWENFSDVSQADLVYSKWKGPAAGIYEELRDYTNGSGGRTSFETLRNSLESRVGILPRDQSSCVIFDDHDENQYAPITNAIGKDSGGAWNLDKLKAYYLGVYMAWLSLSEDKRERVSIMEYSGTAEGYTNPIFFMYGDQGYVNVLAEGEKIFSGFAEFSQNVREVIKEILNYKGKVEVRRQSIGDAYEGIIEVDFKDRAGNSVKMYTLCVNLREGRYRADIQAFDKDKLAMGMLDSAALLFLRSGQIVTEPKWAKLQTALSIVLIEKRPVTVERIRERLESQMKALGILKQDLKLSAEYAAGLLDELLAVGLIKKEKGCYSISGDRECRRAALWCNDYDYIRKEIESKLEDLSQLNALLLSYEKYAKELWPYYPVEAYYPIWDAVSTMDKTMETRLVSDISEIEKRYALEDRLKEFYSHPIFNTIRLTLLPASEMSEDWLEKYAPNLIGKTIIIAAPEISRMAGGLGRVTVSKSVAIERFIKDKARLVWVEPLYNDFDEDSGGKIMDDLEVEFRGKVIQCEVYRRIKEIAVPDERGDIQIFKIPDYLVRDKERYYVGKLYKYEQEDSRVTQDEFSDFFSAAVIALTNRMAKMADDTNGEKGWKNILLNLHDGQILPAAFYRRYLYQKDPEKYAALARIPISGVTHTYNNRIKLYFRSIEEARAFLRDKMGIENKYHWYYLSMLPDGQIVVDNSSAGLRTSHVSSGVSRIQGFEMSMTDALPLYGISNGDLRELSAIEFRKILLGLYPEADVEHPTIDQMIAADKKAKENLIAMLREKKNNPLIISGYLEIDPEKIIISYSGRLVPEKFGIGEGRVEDEGGTEDLKAFTKENIKRAVREGAQIIIFGNVQPYKASVRIYNELRELAREIEGDKDGNGENSVYKGVFILVDKFTPDEQRVLLAATQLQGQISRRKTGAEEFKEANVAVSGGKQIAAPWIEGGTQISLGKVGVNLIVPYDNTEEAFLRAFERDIDFYNISRRDYAWNEVVSIALSRKLNVANEMSAYLTWWSNEIGRESAFDINLVPRNDAMTEANVKLSIRGIQISRVEPSLGEIELTDFSEGRKDVSINLRIAPGVEPPRVYIETNALSSSDSPDNLAWTIIPLELVNFYQGKAMYVAHIEGIKREKFDLTWRVADIWLGKPYNNAIVYNNGGRTGL